MDEEMRACRVRARQLQISMQQETSGNDVGQMGDCVRKLRALKLQQITPLFSFSTLGVLEVTRRTLDLNKSMHQCFFNQIITAERAEAHW